MAQDPVQIARRYFDAWNQHDAGAIVATFAEGGTYADPVTPGPLTGAAIGAYAQALWDAFPDLSFDIVSLTADASGLVSAEWLMRGTDTGPFNRLPPTGAAIVIPGADFVRVRADQIQSVQGYFDSGAVPRALGLDVIVQPKSHRPLQFRDQQPCLGTGTPRLPERSASHGWKPARTKSGNRSQRAHGKSRLRCSRYLDSSVGLVRPSVTA